nr:GIY-YIG endonuclease [Cordyceps militaris]
MEPKFIYSYTNPYLQRIKIYKDLQYQSGIYLWTNINSNKKYVGSSVNLTRRLKDYFNSYYLKSELLKNNSLIYKALLKYGYENFRLDILEFCDPKFILVREQFYLDNLNLEYNTLKTAGSLLGFKHSNETKKKLSGSKLGKPFLGNIENSYSNRKSIKIEVKNIYTNEILYFVSIRRTALFLDVHYSYISRCLTKDGFCKYKDYYITKTECNDIN